MKKSIVVILLLILSSSSVNIFSQAVGVKGGMNFSNMLEESDLGDFSENYKFLSGYNLGVFIEIPSNGIVLETGLFLNTRGFKLEESNDVLETAVKAEFSTLYLDVPIKAKVVKSLAGFDFFASGGVYGAYGLSGTLDMDITFQGVTSSDVGDLSWGDDPDEDDILRIDYGVVGSIGVEFKSIILELNYSHGLANLSPYTEENYTMSNMMLGVSLGYKFGL